MTTSDRIEQAPGTVSIFFLKVSSSDKVVATDLALQRLAALDERKSDVLEMRLCGGRSIDETAAAWG